MSERTKHVFVFTAAQICDAAGEERDYHLNRIDHWQARFDMALAYLKANGAVKVIEQQVTGGTRVAFDVDFGPDGEFHQRELRVAESKIDAHKDAAESYGVHARVYGSQAAGADYMLDAEDVRYFRLGGDPRPE